MFTRIRRWIRQFFTRTRSINKQPLNPISLIVLILIDIFILVNVFSGLNDISQWSLSPNGTYPCYSEWQSYRTSKAQGKDFDAIQRATIQPYLEPTSSRSLAPPISTRFGFQEVYQKNAEEHLGSVSPTCLAFGGYKDKINNAANTRLFDTIDQKQKSIQKLENSNRSIRAQYDSTLLEKIAGQNQEQSINNVGAEKAKTQLDQNNRQIAQLKQEIDQLKADLLAKPESTEFLKYLNNDATFSQVEQGYKQAAFWYPSIQLIFQGLFLLPLLASAAFVHQLARRKNYGLIALISWHLLIIFFIPLILKIFEFLQVGALFEFLFDIISAIFGSLLFLVSYAYILLIPIAGFVLIKLFQRLATRNRVSPSSLVQQSRCLNCTRTLKHNENYCPHCGYHQHLECHSCHQPTYKQLPYCSNCGTEQDLSRSL